MKENDRERTIERERETERDRLIEEERQAARGMPRTQKDKEKQ